MHVYVCMCVSEWVGGRVSTRNRMYIILTLWVLRARICASASGNVDETKPNLLCSRQRTHRRVVKRKFYTLEGTCVHTYRNTYMAITTRRFVQNSERFRGTNPCALIGTLVQRSNYRAFFRDNVIVRSIWHSEIRKIDRRSNERVRSVNVSTIRDPINLLNRFISRKTIS